MQISKSDYMLYLRHPAWLWLKKFDKLKLPLISDNDQATFDAGHDFESYVEQLFPKSTKLGFHDYNSYLTLPVRTEDALQNGALTIFQGRFEAGEITCIVDILQKVAGEENTFDLIEIKSSTKVKEEHQYDLAFQLLVLEQAGLQIRQIRVIHANKEYVRHGKIEPEQISAQTDVTAEVKALLDITREQVERAVAMLRERRKPDFSPRFTNQLEVKGVQWFKEWLEIFKSLQNDLPKYSIYDICQISKEQVAELEDQGIKLLKEIPEDFALSPKQLAQVKATKENRRLVEVEPIKELLQTLQYPLYFFDYETFSSLIPRFDGCGPYQDYPFQYSLHILEKEGAEVKHKEYLPTENGNPMPGLLKQLQEDIGTSGTVLTWNMRYEKSCNDRMGQFYPEYQEFLRGLNERINDLMIPFSQLWLVDQGFMGSASVKKVLPVMVPSLSYKELNVSDGLLARRTWTETVLEGKNEDRKEQIVRDLLEYCGLDTWAMVEILGEVRNTLKY